MKELLQRLIRDQRVSALHSEEIGTTAEFIQKLCRIHEGFYGSYEAVINMEISKMEDCKCRILSHPLLLIQEPARRRLSNEEEKITSHISSMAVTIGFERNPNAGASIQQRLQGRRPSLRQAAAVGVSYSQSNRYVVPANNKYQTLLIVGREERDHKRHDIHAVSPLNRPLHFIATIANTA